MDSLDNCSPCAGIDNKTRKSFGRPLISLDFIKKNVELAIRNDEPYNSYLLSFAKSNFIDIISELVETNNSIKKLMNHRSLKKEITEAYGAIQLIENVLVKSIEISKFEFLEARSILDSTLVNTESIDIHEFSNCKALQERLVFFDICSGKGILSFLLASMFPLSKIHMIDFNSKIKADHLRDNHCKNINYMHMDIFQESFYEFMTGETLKLVNQGYIPIAIGLHLCGNLSTRLVNLFSTTNLSIAIISPCCLPPRSKSTVAVAGSAADFRDVVTRNHWSLYNYWCLSLFLLLDGNICHKNLIEDDKVVSEKSKYIVAYK